MLITMIKFTIFIEIRIIPTKSDRLFRIHSHTVFSRNRYSVNLLYIYLHSIYSCATKKKSRARYMDMNTCTYITSFIIIYSNQVQYFFYFYYKIKVKRTMTTQILTTKQHSWSCQRQLNTYENLKTHVRPIQRQP